MQTIPILLPRLDALHARLDRVQGLRDIHRHHARHGADAECRGRAEFFPGRDVRLRELPQGGVYAEAGSRVCRLARGGGDEPGEEGGGPALAEDEAGAVEEAAHARVGALAVVDEAGFDGLEGGDGEDGLDDAGAEAGEDGAGAGDCAGLRV